MYAFKGSCHCGNVCVELALTRPPKEYNPRACDCDFCRKHGASYVSDPNGSLVIHVRDENALHRYRQGSNTADMVLCANCGVLIGGAYQAAEGVFATINVMIIDGDVTFGETKPASPKELNAAEKVRRWTDLWFANVLFDRTGS
jgi:Uncharacterized conserved protein